MTKDNILGGILCFVFIGLLVYAPWIVNYFAV